MSTNQNDEPSAYFVSWSQEVAGRFLSVHFVITLLLLGFWLWALTGPLSALNALYPNLTDAQTGGDAKNAIEFILKSAGAVSALFSTVIGVVLGYYFGQRGVERAESAQARAEQLKGEVTSDFEDDGEALAVAVEDLNEQLDLRDAALDQAVELLEGFAAEVDSESALGELLFPDEGEDGADDEEEDEDDDE